jgi:4-hydroxybenzoyl-CoA thioesterase
MNKFEYLKAYDLAGHPVVETRARFHIPTRYGDEVEVNTAFVECGRSSFKLRHRLSKAGTLAVEAAETRVWAIRSADDPKRLTSHPIPPEVLARFNRDSA